MSYVFEHLEIACYRSLIGAAEELGDAETAELCTEILREGSDGRLARAAASRSDPGVPTS
jgi:ferritin-like metal-binding protein YciE